MSSPNIRVLRVERTPGASVQRFPCWPVNVVAHIRARFSLEGLHVVATHRSAGGGAGAGAGIGVHELVQISRSLPCFCY